MPFSAGPNNLILNDLTHLIFQKIESENCCRVHSIFFYFYVLFLRFISTNIGIYPNIHIVRLPAIFGK